MNFDPPAAHALPEANLALTPYHASLRRNPTDLEEKRRGMTMAIPYLILSFHQMEVLRSTRLYQRFSRAIIAMGVGNCR